MFDALKQKIFRCQLSKNNPRPTRFPHWDAVKSILILYESDLAEKNQTVKDLVQRLLHEDKEVATWGYADKRYIQSPILPQNRIIGKKDINCFGGLKSGIVKDLQSHEYDLLIDLTQNTSLPLAYAALSTKACFKAGRLISTKGQEEQAQSDGIHDLIIKMPVQEDVTPLYEQITLFIKMIQSKD